MKTNKHNNQPLKILHISTKTKTSSHQNNSVETPLTSLGRFLVRDIILSNGLQ